MMKRGYDAQVHGDMYSGGCFLNVMAVQESEQRKLERLGIGIIFEQAWIETNPAEDREVDGGRAVNFQYVPRTVPITLSTQTMTRIVAHQQTLITTPEYPV